MKRAIFITLIVTGLFMACNGPLEGFGVKPLVPAAPAIEAGDGSLRVSWDAVELAESYNVYYGISATPPTEPAKTTSETTTTINGLVNGTTYYLWVQAANARGTSPLSIAANGTPTG